MSGDPRPVSRRELLACGAALLFVLGVRVLASHFLAFSLTEGEELLNLRLARQLRGGFPVGDLGRYWYTGVGGQSGAGTLVMALLYVPLAVLGEPDVWACRLLAGGWSVLGAVALAGIGRSLLGSGGALAGLLGYALCAPAWTVFSMSAWGNYTEAAALSLLALWLLAAGRGPKAAAGLGFVAVFSVWFNYAALPASGLALGLGVVGMRRQPKAVAALVGGALLAALPWLIGFAPSASVDSPVNAAKVGAVLSELRSDPGRWPLVVLGTLKAMPVLEWKNADLRWVPTWLDALSGPWKLLAWVSLSVAGVWALRSRAAFGARAAFVALGLAALASPLALTVLGTGPEALELPQNYFWDPRRAAIVYPAWGLAWGWVGWRTWQLGRGGRAAVGGAVGIAAFAQLAAVTSGVPAPSPFRPILYLICPEKQPVEEGVVCVAPLFEDMVPTLEAMVDRPELDDFYLRAAALSGYDAVNREEDGCGLFDHQLPHNEVEAWARAGWWGLGAASGPCPDDRAEEFCQRAGQQALQDACFDGFDFGREHTPPPDDYAEKMKARGEQP